MFFCTVSGMEGAYGRGCVRDVDSSPHGHGQMITFTGTIFMGLRQINSLLKVTEKATSASNTSELLLIQDRGRLL